MPTYTKSQITPLKNNYNGATPDASYISGWKLTLDGLASGLSIALDIRNLLTRFSLHEQITRLVCVEGWSAIAWWAGLRFDDLLRAYPPMSQAKWARVESSVNLDASGNPDPYFMSLDLVAAALLDDQVGPAQLEELRIQAPDAQALLARVEVYPDERFSVRYPRELGASVTIRTKDQSVFVKEQHGYEGGLNNPMSWDRTVEKFHWLSEAFADEDLRIRIINAVQQLDARPISDLMDLLAQVRCTAVFPRAHPGIQ